MARLPRRGRKLTITRPKVASRSSRLFRQWHILNQRSRHLLLVTEAGLFLLTEDGRRITT